MLMRIALTALFLLPALGTSQNLILNNLHAQIIAYEIPESEGRAEAVHYIEAIRDRFYPGVEIVDATALDDAALRQKLQGTPVLYTTLGENSRLLRLAARPLPLRIENGTLHWGDFSAPVKDLRIVFVGQHPFGEGYSVVYAAGSNALLAQANSVFHGPCSYHIFQGAGRGELLREGFYDKSFVEKPDRLSLADATADVQEFFSTLEHSHPKLLAKVDHSAYTELKKQTVSDLAARLGQDGNIRIEDLAYSLYYAGAFFKDGHTGLQWQWPPLNEANTRGKRFPPFWLDSENARFFIASASDASLLGTEILGVNGTPVEGFLKPILDRISGETRTYRAAGLAANQAFWYYLTNVFADESYTLTVRDMSGATRQAAIRTLGFAEFRRLAPPARRSGDTRVEFLDDGKIARLVIPSLVYGPDRKKTEEVFDQAFGQIRERASTDLIIDIRGNGGGDSRMGDYVLRFVRPKQSARPKSFFAGKTYMLTNHLVFSSAVMFADAFRDYNVGTIVGYETGGTPSHYGQPQSFTLKNSGIAFGVSSKHFNAPKPRPGDDEHGVLPDVAVNRELLVPYRTEADPVLAFALAHIRQSRERPRP
jgi:hypothetical protein